MGKLLYYVKENGEGIATCIAGLVAMVVGWNQWKGNHSKEDNSRRVWKQVSTVIFLVLTVLLVFDLTVYFYYDYQGTEDNQNVLTGIEIATVTQSPSALTPQVTAAETIPESTATPSPTFSPSLEDMLKWSNNGYYDVQDLKEKRTTDILDKYTIAHRNYGKIR